MQVNQNLSVFQIVKLSDDVFFNNIWIEQNALLWRNPAGSNPPIGTTMVSTKMPCDECSPVMSDAGVTRVVSVPQLPKSPDDPARFRGLTYDKLDTLIPDRWVFIT